ncbi:unnamed protein product [Rhizophagus irregularis]|nr:unnamed protein product [Rhizophagus irregularis]
MRNFKVNNLILNQHLLYIPLPTIDELQVNNENTEEIIENGINDIVKDQKQSDNSSDESDGEHEKFETLQEKEFHTNCHSVLNHLNSLKEISKFFNNFNSKNIIQNDETIERFEVGRMH